MDKNSKPSVDEVAKYLRKWDSLENYVLQENALNKLFFDLCVSNDDIRKFYKLEKYNLKDIDRYLWQLGKDYFPKKY